MAQSATALLETLPAALLGGPEMPRIDPVFEAAFAAAEPDLPRADMSPSAAAPAYGLLTHDLLPFAAETPTLQLGFVGQTYAEVVDLHDTSYTSLGLAPHGIP